MGEIDHLLADPAVQVAIEAQREAERSYVLSDDKNADPQMWCAITTVIAFARAGGNCEKIRNLTEGFAQAQRRARSRLTLVED